MAVSKDKVYCTQHDLLICLWRAFLSGRGSPYELKAQEADRLLKELVEQSEKRFRPERLKKYCRYDDESLWDSMLRDNWPSSD